MRWNGRGELVCPLRGQSLESRLAAQPSVRQAVAMITWRQLDAPEAGALDILSRVIATAEGTGVPLFPISALLRA